MKVSAEKKLVIKKKGSPKATLTNMKEPTHHRQPPDSTARDELVFFYFAIMSPFTCRRLLAGRGN